jgi:dihydropteroate synthase
MPDNSLFLQEPNFKFVQMESTFSKYINVNGHLLDLSVPRVMGILNVTPDSFYAGSRQQTETDIATRARQILDEGACIIDIGAYSSRPDAQHISAPRNESPAHGWRLSDATIPMPSSLLILSVPMWPKCVSPNTAWPLSMT